MGCANTHSIRTLSIASSKVVPIGLSLYSEKLGSFKVRISEAIKKKDPILFEMTLQSYNLKINDLTSSYDHKRTIFHHIAEHNFSEGMSILIEFIFQRDPNKLHLITTSADFDGNTSAMVCCKHRAIETLSVILKWELVDMNLKNYQGKTVVEVAFDYWSPCINLLTSVSLSSSKLTNKFNTSSTELIGSPRSRANISGTGKINKRETQKFSFNEKELNTAIMSVLSLVKETSVKVSYQTKLFSLLAELKEKETNFVDPEFPHDMLSITGEDTTDTFAGSPNTLKWSRPSDFLNTEVKKITVFEAFGPNDATACSLAGCELYAAICALMEFPKRLLNVFTSREINQFGCVLNKILSCWYITGDSFRRLFSMYCSRNSTIFETKIK